MLNDVRDQENKNQDDGANMGYLKRPKKGDLEEQDDEDEEQCEDQNEEL